MATFRLVDTDEYGSGNRSIPTNQINRMYGIKKECVEYWFTTYLKLQHHLREFANTGN
jgi:hypothetical protein